jgi:uncharacterized protein (TIGR02996 family)
MSKFNQFNVFRESFDGFNTAIDSSNDWDNYLVYADWLEDNNQEILANLIRLLHKKEFANNGKERSDLNKKINDYSIQHHDIIEKAPFVLPKGYVLPFLSMTIHNDKRPKKLNVDNISHSIISFSINEDKIDFLIYLYGNHLASLEWEYQVGNLSGKFYLIKYNDYYGYRRVMKTDESMDFLLIQPVGNKNYRQYKETFATPGSHLTRIIPMSDDPKFGVGSVLINNLFVKP